MDSIKQEVRKIIESAFDGVPRPKTSLRQFVLVDKKGMAGTITDDEWRLAGVTRTDAKWQDISELEIEHCECQLAHMQAEDFRYYLPAYMLYSLSHAQDSIVNNGVPGFVVFGLTPSKELASYTAKQYSLLSTSQRAAVVAFLRFMAEHAEEYSSSDAKIALARWNVSA